MRHIIRDRIVNLSRDAIKSKEPTYKGLAGAGGAISYALLEVANAINGLTQARYQGVLNWADSMVKEIDKLDDEAANLNWCADNYKDARAKLDQANAFWGINA